MVIKFPWNSAVDGWGDAWPGPFIASYTISSGGTTQCTYSADITGSVAGETTHLSVTAAIPSDMIAMDQKYLEATKEQLKKALNAQILMEMEKIKQNLFEAEKVKEAVAKQHTYYFDSGDYFDGVHAMPHHVVNAFGEFVDPSKKPPTHGDLARKLRAQVSGLDEWVMYPCDCPNAPGATIWAAIQHLNDYHHPDRRREDTWTRERIADWLDALPFDLTINTKEAA
jgi:hypothetical protein